MKCSGNKVLVFGIDGGTFDIILPMVEKGRLPNIAGILSGGAWGDLRSTIHPITPAAWSSFATGKNPGKHGIFDFSSPDPDSFSFKLQSAKERKGESFWMCLSRFGKKSIVLNIPFTYPPEKVNGIMISGFDSPGSNRSMAYPPGIYEELVGEFGKYTPDWTFPTGRKYDFDSYRREVISAIRQRTESSLYLLRKYPWDIFITVFNSIDHIQHVFFGMGEEGRKFIEEGYELMDKALGDFLEEIGQDTTVVIMSDHGAGEIKRFFYLDQWLEREGFLAYKDDMGAGSLMRRVMKKGRYMLKRALPVKVRGYLRGRMPGVRDFVSSYSTGPETDWSRSYAYSGGMYGNIYINREGKSPGGIVKDSEYDDLCTEIISRLCNLQDPETDERVVEKVYRKEEIYHGPFLHMAPDLIIKWKDYAYFTKKGIDVKGTVFGNELKLDSSDYPHTGTHRLNGIFMAKGPSIVAGKKVEGLQIIDVAPTILLLMNNPIPDDMDGRIITEIMRKDFLEDVSSEYCRSKGRGDTLSEGEALTPEEEASVAERLKSLGYID